jgi:hypothetical protein
MFETEIKENQDFYTPEMPLQDKVNIFVGDHAIKVMKVSLHIATTLK